MSGSSKIGTASSAATNNAGTTPRTSERTSAPIVESFAAKKMHQRELREFRGLEAERARAEPAARAAGLQPDVRDEREQQQHERVTPMQRRRDALEFAVIDAIRDEREPGRRRQPHQLPLEKVRGVVIAWRTPSRSTR